MYEHFTSVYIVSRSCFLPVAGECMRWRLEEVTNGLISDVTKPLLLTVYSLTKIDLSLRDFPTTECLWMFSL